MCRTCWEEHGRPLIDNARTRAAANLVEMLYDEPDGVVGGHLHIVTDDWNVEDSHLEFCLQCIRANAEQWDPHQIFIEEMLSMALLMMTVEERVSVLAMVDRYDQ